MYVLMQLPFQSHVCVCPILAEIMEHLFLQSRTEALPSADRSIRGTKSTEKDHHRLVVTGVEAGGKCYKKDPFSEGIVRSFLT